MHCGFDTHTKNETHLQQSLCYKQDTIFLLKVYCWHHNPFSEWVGLFNVASYQSGSYEWRTGCRVVRPMMKGPQIWIYRVSNQETSGLKSSVLPVDQAHPFRYAAAYSVWSFMAERGSLCFPTDVTNGAVMFYIVYSLCDNRYISYTFFY